MATNATGSPSKNHNPRHRKMARHCTRISSHTVAGTYLYAPQLAATGTSSAMLATRGERAISARNRILSVLPAGTELEERDVTCVSDTSAFDRQLRRLQFFEPRAEAPHEIGFDPDSERNDENGSNGRGQEKRVCKMQPG
jgi:hypothetical protein